MSKNKPISYKEKYRKIQTSEKINYVPHANIISERLKYKNSGKLTNAHKKFLNMVSSQRVAKKNYNENYNENNKYITSITSMLL